MLRQRFETELKRLEQEVLDLGRVVHRAVTRSVEALVARDLVSAAQIVAQDVQINAKRFQIESDTLALIATQQPMARDLRSLATILDVIRELERTGDYAKGISKINLSIGDQELIKPLLDIPRMATLAMTMLDQALMAYVNHDEQAAREIPLRDVQVDQLYDQIRRELMSLILADRSKIEQANMLLWAAHNLERAADRVTNICERIVFLATGELADLPDGRD
ncbi:MAG: phosphate signaling complex protein PhoU [Anaerolineae bacterium]|jgi:phosphate transport system protein